MDYSFRLTARVLLYEPSHIQDNTYRGICGTLAGTRNSSMGKRSILDLMRIISVFYHWECNERKGPFRCLYTKSNSIDDHSNISSKLLQKQNFKQRCQLVRFIRKLPLLTTERTKINNLCHNKLCFVCYCIRVCYSGILCQNCAS